MKLEVKDGTFGYGEEKVLDGISFSVSSGEILAILGPNGVGKTTLFKCLLGIQKFWSGSVLVDGEDTRQWGSRRLAQVLGYVPQSHVPPFPYTVFDVVLMGRTAHLPQYASPSRRDREIAMESLEKLEIAHMAKKIYTQISGGERQMVLIARALTQRPQFLFMDEPTANLDYGNQVRVLTQVRELKEQGYGIVMNTHSPEHAFLCATHVALLRRDGCLLGTPEEIVTEQQLRHTYGVNVLVRNVESDVEGEGLKCCIPLLRK